jgi:hypothetical protein
MPWGQTTPMDPKTRFIADYLRETFSFAELCARGGGGWLRIPCATFARTYFRPARR